ncbi:MAG: TraB/GumN family protein [Pyrinomonadaceae bacterium]|nr:TraB/GumN family protein [Pyrinomonadaceae bacterium]
MNTLRLFLITLISLAAVSNAQYLPETENDAIFFEITGNNIEKPSYLFGTIHIMCDDEEFPRAVLARAVSSTDHVVMEIDLSNLPEVIKKSAKALRNDSNPPKELKPFPEVLSKSENDLVVRAVNKYSILPLRIMKGLPLEAVVAVLAASPKALGCESIESYELKIVDAAKSNQKKTYGLETIEEQFKLIESERKKTSTKKRMLEFIAETATRKAQFIELREIYFSQNADKLFDFATTKLKVDPKFQAILLDERNKAWIPKIEKHVNGGAVFIAVGSAHLGGENGLLNLLRAKGYDLKPIKLKVIKRPVNPVSPPPSQ